MKKITLTDPVQFTTIWQGLHGGADGGTAGLENINHFVKVLDILEAISTGDGLNRTLTKYPVERLLEDADLNLLKTKLGNVKWNTQFLKTAQKVLVILKDAETVKQVKEPTKPH